MAFFRPGLSRPVAAILLAAGGPAFAARWSAIDAGLPSASPGVVALAIDPAAQSTLYALTDHQAIYKSEDAGGSWRPVKGVAGVFAFAIAPGNSSAMYAATGHGVVKSRDGGETWNSANSGLEERYVYSLTINPIDSSMLYGVSSNGIFRSVNAGANWTALGSGSSAGMVIFGSLIIDPVTPTTLYAPDSNRGLVKSVNGGETWTAIRPTLDNEYVITSLAVDPVASSTIYASYLPLLFIPSGGSPTGGVFKSTDGGQTWKAYQDGMPATFFVTSLIIDPRTPSTIYGVVKSNEGGGLVKSVDGGQSWHVINEGLPGDFRGPVAIDPSAPSTLYAGNIFKSTQGGANWKRADAGLAGVDARALAIDPLNPSTIYAGVDDGVFKRAADGTGWTKLVAFELHNSFSLLPGGPPLAGPGPAQPRSLTIDPRNTSVLYTWTARPNGCVVFDRLLFKSSDSGASWNDDASPRDNPCVTDGFLVMHPTDSNTLYLVESDAFDGAYWVRKTVDGGATWSNIWYSEEFGPNALLIDPASPSTLYAGMGGGVFTSADGGSSWNNAGLQDANVTALAMDPAGVLFAATAGSHPDPLGFRHLFKSLDGGATWTPSENGLAGLASAGAVITSMVVASSDGRVIYAGTSGDGVYKSADGGAGWLKMNDGLSNLQVRLLVWANSLYAATAGGIFKTVE